MEVWFGLRLRLLECCIDEEELGEEIDDAGERGDKVLELFCLCWNETFFWARTLAAWRVLFSR